MSLARGKFGIEYNPRQMDDGSSGLGWVFAVIALVALVSLAWTLVGRIRSAREDVPVPSADVPPVETNGVQTVRTDPVVPAAVLGG